MPRTRARPPKQERLELSPSHLDWFRENGVGPHHYPGMGRNEAGSSLTGGLDLRLLISSANGHSIRSNEISKELDKGNLRNRERLMDEYLESCRAASNLNGDIARGLRSNKSAFLNTHPQVSEKEYGGLVRFFQVRAEKHQSLLTKHENRYEKRYGEKREPYAEIARIRELVRAQARSFLEEAGHVPSGESVYRRTEGTAVARKTKGLPKTSRGPLGPESESREAKIRELKEERKLLKEGEPRNIAEEIRALNQRINKLRREREGA